MMPIARTLIPNSPTLPMSGHRVRARRASAQATIPKPMNIQM
jgi:hypothetical protein